MKEAQIKKKAIEILKNEGFIWWFPAKVKFYKNDIFGVFDGVIASGSLIKFLQLTTTNNISNRKKKIKGFLKETGFKANIEIWGYNKKKKNFRIIKIR